jgi:hypothetical protein
VSADWKSLVFPRYPSLETTFTQSLAALDDAIGWEVVRERVDGGRLHQRRADARALSP